MAIIKVWIEDGCTGCGLCADICPEVFEMDGDAKVIAGADYAINEAGIKEAVESCPAEVIKFGE